MAKKSSGKVKGLTSKEMTKVIIPIISTKTGAYTFRESVIPSSQVQDTLKKYAQQGT